MRKTKRKAMQKAEAAAEKGKKGWYVLGKFYTKEEAASEE